MHSRQMLYIELCPWTQDAVCIKFFGLCNKIFHNREAHVAQIHFWTVLESGRPRPRASVVSVY